MCTKTSSLLAVGKREKARCYLYFIQAALSFTGRFSINELREHNKPNDTEYDSEL
jgi:hypothetical protein